MITFPGSAFVYLALMALVVAGVGTGLCRMLAAEHQARQAHDAWAADALQRARKAERERHDQRLEHELGILGHECGPGCPRKRTSEEEWKALLRRCPG